MLKLKFVTTLYQTIKNYLTLLIYRHNFAVNVVQQFKLTKTGFS